MGLAHSQPPSCVRCRQPFATDSPRETARPADPGPSSSAPAASSSAPADSPLDLAWLEKSLLDNWELDDELNEAQCLVKSLGGNHAPSTTTLRIDPEHRAGDTPTRGCQQAELTSRELSSQRDVSGPGLQATPERFVLLFSLGAFILGSGLICCSLVTDRVDLWRFGLPSVLVGQAGVIIGLILQLSRLRRSQSITVERLDELEQRLHEVQRTVAPSSTSRGLPTSTSIYWQLAHGASPNLLLADLQGQLDLLNSRLRRDR